MPTETVLVQQTLGAIHVVAHVQGKSSLPKQGRVHQARHRLDTLQDVEVRFRVRYIEELGEISQMPPYVGWWYDIHVPLLADVQAELLGVGRQLVELQSLEEC